MLLTSANRSVMTGEELREGMRLVPSPVTIITAGSGKNGRGITIGSFTSTSLDPPLVTFNVSCGANFHHLLEDGRLLAVHILSDSQAALSNKFAIPDLSSEQQFADVDVNFDDDGPPMIAGTLGIFRCRVAAMYSAGDHSVIVARVIDFAAGEEGEPLVYHNQAYRSLS